MIDETEFEWMQVYLVIDRFNGERSEPFQTITAARDAAWAARLNVIMAITSDLDVPQQHRDHAAARWRVWQKGYALLCDVDGVLYVYAREEVGA